jgi:branched-chain amino acid transport system permease protein
MSVSLFLMQLLNGVQLGVLLFLMAAGLTLVFGIMNFVNLAHGSLYMLGAYFAAVTFAHSGSFLLSLVAGGVGLFIIGVAADRFGLSELHKRSHLDQVLATFGIVMFCNELVRMIWGSSPLFMDVPAALSESVPLLGMNYPAYRLAIIAVGVAVALLLFVIIERTRLGMLIRAGASNRSMVSALGINIGWLNTFVFALGAGLAGIAGAMVGPILSIQPGMGEPVLILTLVVIVIGGIGSVRGAFLGALIVGIVDTLGRTVLPFWLRQVFDPAAAAAMGPAVASVLVYVVMAVILAFKPEGLFPVRKR